MNKLFNKKPIQKQKIKIKIPSHSNLQLIQPIM